MTKVAVSVSETTPRPPFIFIVGRGRSGTTLVRAILDSHPLLAIPGESHFLVSMATCRRYREKNGRVDIRGFVADLLASAHFRAWGLAEGEVSDSYLRDPPGNIADALRRPYELYARMQGKPRYGDKTPIHVLHIPLLSQLFPEARFLHVIRDGRNVALSYLSVPFGPDTLVEAALRWKWAVRSGRRAGMRLGPTRYMEIRYEALVEDPESVMRGVCSFLDLPFDPIMLRYYDRASDLLGSVDSISHHKNLLLPPTKGLRDWRLEMDPYDVALFDVLAGDLLDELGYRRCPVKSRKVWFDARLRHVCLQLHRSQRAARKRMQRLASWVPQAMGMATALPRGLGRRG